MTMQKNDALLIARAQDLLARAARGELTCTPYLTPAEQMLLRRHLPRYGEDWCLWGGFETAERKRAYFLPPYLSMMDEPYRTECFLESAGESVAVLEVQGSGYRELTHRDYLGALLHLGVERDRVGDICVTAPDRAILLCDTALTAFFAENLCRVASDAVRVFKTDLPDGFDGGRKFKPVTDTVASPRADAVVAALANLSRERAQSLFREERVEIDYEVEKRPDRAVDEGTVLTIRGVGKFIIRSLGEQTKKGRYRLLADQYI